MMYDFDYDYGHVVEDEYNTDYRTQYDKYLQGELDEYERALEEGEYQLLTGAYQHEPVFADQASNDLWSECIAHEQKRLYLALNGVCIPEWERTVPDYLKPWDDNNLPF